MSAYLCISLMRSSNCHYSQLKILASPMIGDETLELKSDYTQGRKIDLKLFMKKGQDYIPVRICAIAKTDEDVKKSQHQMKKSNHNKMATDCL